MHFDDMSMIHLEFFSKDNIRGLLFDYLRDESADEIKLKAEGKLSGEEIVQMIGAGKGAYLKTNIACLNLAGMRRVIKDLSQPDIGLSIAATSPSEAASASEPQRVLLHSHSARALQIISQQPLMSQDHPISVSVISSASHSAIVSPSAADLSDDGSGDERILRFSNGQKFQISAPIPDPDDVVTMHGDIKLREVKDHEDLGTMHLDIDLGNHDDLVTMHWGIELGDVANHDVTVHGDIELGEVTDSSRSRAASPSIR